MGLAIYWKQPFHLQSRLITSQDAACWPPLTVRAAVKAETISHDERQIVKREHR